MPDRTSDEIQQLVVKEMGRITERTVLTQLRSVLIKPRMEMREWCWARPILSFPIWVVAESKDYDYGIAYSDYGFGPDNAWGLIFLSHKDFDADYCWYNSLEAAFLDSRLVEE